MKRSTLFFLIVSCLIINTVKSTETQCHPQCSWKCDDPHCPAICDPVCEPPKCHTSCAEPKNAICDVKCEKPECEIKCPDKGCEMADCPKCVTVCKQPHCVTHCQAPKPECEPVCEEPKCDWKCHKPNCPKPKCELVCENPNCVPKVECCDCNLGGAPHIGSPLPFFKETEKNKNCCSCGNKASDVGVTNISARNIGDFQTLPNSQIVNTGTHLLNITNRAEVKLNDSPVQIGTSQYTRSLSNNPAFDKDVSRFNLQKSYSDRQ